MGLLRLSAVLTGALLLLAACRGAEETLPGHPLGKEPAPPFRLQDASGKTVSLSDYRGRPVVLTFLYTDCPDVCPVIARRVGQALASIGKDAGKVAVLAVSVDPAGDTPEKATAFMATHGLTGEGRHFLLGDAATLEPVWLSYGIGQAGIGTAQRQPGEPAQMGRIGHTDAVFLIDRDGRERTLLRGEASADEIARGLRILLR